MWFFFIILPSRGTFSNSPLKGILRMQPWLGHALVALRFCWHIDACILPPSFLLETRRPSPACSAFACPGIMLFRDGSACVLAGFGRNSRTGRFSRTPTQDRDRLSSPSSYPEWLCKFGATADTYNGRNGNASCAWKFPQIKSQGYIWKSSGIDWLTHLLLAINQ